MYFIHIFSAMHISHGTQNVVKKYAQQLILQKTLSNHRVARLCLHWHKSHQPFLWRYRELGCQSSNTPEPIDMKSDVGDYVGDITPHAKIQNDRSIGGVWMYGRNIILAWFVVFFFCNPKFCLQDKTVKLIFTHLLSITSIPGYCITRKVEMQKFPFSPILTTKTAQKGSWIGILSQICKIFKLLNYQNQLSNSNQICTVIKTIKYSLWVIPKFAPAIPK